MWKRSLNLSDNQHNTEAWFEISVINHQSDFCSASLLIRSLISRTIIPPATVWNLTFGWLQQFKALFFVKTVRMNLSSEQLHPIVFMDYVNSFSSIVTFDKCYMFSTCWLSMLTHQNDVTSWKALKKKKKRSHFPCEKFISADSYINGDWASSPVTIEQLLSHAACSVNAQPQCILSGEERQKTCFYEGAICHSRGQISSARRNLFVGAPISKTGANLAEAIMSPDKGAKQQRGEKKFHGHTFV